jgi:hypothetical protein
LERTAVSSPDQTTRRLAIAALAKIGPSAYSAVIRSHLEPNGAVRVDQVCLGVNFRADPGLYIWESSLRHEVICLSVRAHQTPSNRPTLAGVEVHSIRIIVSILDLIDFDLI